MRSERGEVRRQKGEVRSEKEKLEGRSEKGDVRICVSSILVDYIIDYF